MKAPDRCPKCGANRRYRRCYLDPVFDCRSHIDVMDLVESRRCLERQRDQLLARVKRLEEAGDGLLELVEAEACDLHLADQIQPRADKWRKAKEPHP